MRADASIGLYRLFFGLRRNGKVSLRRDEGIPPYCHKISG